MSPETFTQPRETSPVRGMTASLIFAVMLFAALALWTAIPLGWIYIGSKIAETQFPAEGPYAVVAIGILVSIVIDAWAIGHLNALYMRVTGTNRLAPMRPTWLKSMRDTGSAPGTTTVVEAVLMGSVMLAVIVFIGWFFLLAGSPLPNR
jgi:hypothetical protein